MKLLQHERLDRVYPGQIGRYLDYARFTDDALKGLFEKLEEKEF